MRGPSPQKLAGALPYPVVTKYCEFLIPTAAWQFSWTWPGTSCLIDLITRKTNNAHMYLNAANKQTTQWTHAALAEWKAKHTREARQR